MEKDFSPHRTTKHPGTAPETDAREKIMTPDTSIEVTRKQLAENLRKFLRMHAEGSD